ncbi:MAG: HD family phosphohydrolase [Aggregatilineales bacterium]
MTAWLVRLLERYFGFEPERAANLLHAAGLVAASVIMVLVSTAIVAADVLLVGRGGEALQVGDVIQRNIRAPQSITYVSSVLTQRSQAENAAVVAPVYDPPDPEVARKQSLLARQILDYIKNVRRDPFATIEQKIADINKITALTLSEPIARRILELSDDAWQAVDEQIVNVLERMMREQIKDSDLPALIALLPTQVSVRFNPAETELIVAILEDLIRPNTFLNLEATEQARLAAIAATEPITRTFDRNEIVVREGKRIDEMDFEALQQLGLLKSEDLRLTELAQAFLASLLVLIVTGLYIARTVPTLFQSSRFLLLLAVIFLIVLLGARVVGMTGQIYLYPVAGLALLYVALGQPQLALIGTLGLALLMGLMTGSLLETAAFVSVGGVIGALTLRPNERLNSYFVAGLVISLGNVIVVTIFNLNGLNTLAAGLELTALVLYSFLNGILAAAMAIAGMYVVTLLFNLPTSLKLSELSRPSHPLLQRLLREAPGTYQHSLQVANLSEQAALAIGADAELVRVAALYHDIGKMNNPAFFTENQVLGGGNPHDVLNDPYRSAAIIISHVPDGDEMARQYRLPARLRDFILEHHGTTQVFVFLQRAIEQAGNDELAVDTAEFTYPGPRPRSRETAVMMLADGCEAAVRSRGPSSKQEISEIVQQIIDRRVEAGELDDSGLTLQEIKTIRQVFVEMLQAVFHPRINYPPDLRQQRPSEPTPRTPTRAVSRADVARAPREKPAQAAAPPRELQPVEVLADELDDDSPLPDVPALPRASKSDGKADTREEEAERVRPREDET